MLFRARSRAQLAANSIATIRHMAIKWPLFHQRSMRASVWTAESEGSNVEKKRRATNEQRYEGKEAGGVGDEIVCPSGSTLIRM